MATQEERMASLESFRTETLYAYKDMAMELAMVKGLTSDAIGVMISNPEKCTLSKIGGRADVLMWLHKRIEEKSFEVRKVSALMQSSLVSIVLRMLI